ARVRRRRRVPQHPRGQHVRGTGPDSGSRSHRCPGAGLLPGHPTFPGHGRLAPAPGRRGPAARGPDAGERHPTAAGARPVRGVVLRRRLRPADGLTGTPLPRTRGPV
ncbi:MAG: hypothetical protein AVDCRST_MAG57-544, partial [uncultured Blastococcus sp.]